MPSSLTTTATALTRLPALHLEPNRVIVGAFVQFVDSAGGWRLHEGKIPLPRGRQYLGLLTRRANQRFVDNIPEVMAEVPGGPELPDVDDLNAEIPQSEWPVGLSGKPEPPWRREYVLHFLDILNLSVMTFSNSTIGARRAVTDLEDRWEWAKVLYGSDVLPTFELGETVFPTSFAVRQRPVFDVKTWRRFSDGALRVVDASVLALDAPQPKTNAEMMGDNVPF